MASYTDRFASGPPFRDLEYDQWDDVEIDVVARELLLQAEVDLRYAFQTYASRRALTVDRMIEMHRQQFLGVFPDWAGKIRGTSADHIDVGISFGPYDGVAPELVVTELERLNRHLVELDGRYDTIRTTGVLRDRQQAALRLAAIAHCEMIRIHPFINGNGRSARLGITYVLTRYGMPPVPCRFNQTEYHDAIGAWLNHRNIEAFVDLMNRFLSTWFDPESLR